MTPLDILCLVLVFAYPIYLMITRLIGEIRGQDFIVLSWPQGKATIRRSEVVAISLDKRNDTLHIHTQNNRFEFKGPDLEVLYDQLPKELKKYTNNV